MSANGRLSEKSVTFVTIEAICIEVCERDGGIAVLPCTDFPASTCWNAVGDFSRSNGLKCITEISGSQ